MLQIFQAHWIAPSTDSEEHSSLPKRIMIGEPASAKVRVCRTTITNRDGLHPCIGAHTNRYVALRLLFYCTHLCATFLYVFFAVVSGCSFVAKKIRIAFFCGYYFPFCRSSFPLNTHAHIAKSSVNRRHDTEVRLDQSWSPLLTKHWLPLILLFRFH